MSSLVLQGDTLGKRQQYYNTLVNEAISSKQNLKLEKLNPEEDDIENYFKIDIACNNKDVEYILEVLKSEDMLYVSRAIKRCTWLITDPQYAHIINPEYLHSQLFPHMTSKASNKLTLQIQRKLRDELRVEAFYNYYKHEHLTSAHTAPKWLPYCSLSFIEKEIVVQSSMLMSNVPLFKRICERSIKFLEIFCTQQEFKSDSNYHKKEMLKSTMFLLNTHTEKYLNILETIESFYRPYFGAKAVKLIMKKCPKRIIECFSKYADNMNLETFARMLKKKGNIKEFLLQHAGNENLRPWFTFEHLKHFVQHMPREGRFDFVKKAFIDKKDEKNVSDYESDIWWPEPSNSENIYLWYRFAPFEVAFENLEKLIHSEPSSVRRNDMVALLVACAGRNSQHTHTVLQYYHDKHINESFESKATFVNAVLSQTTIHQCNEKTWYILNNIFSSMGVYTELSNNELIQHCIDFIVVYNVIHNENVPESIENQLKFTSLKYKQTKYNNEEKEKIFNYILNLLYTKMESKNIDTENELKDIVTILEDALCVLINWEKELANYPCILNKIKIISQIKKENNWRVDLMPLFNKKQTWRTLMFEESLVMSPSEETCITALKYDPGLLTRNKTEVDALKCNDAISLKRLLTKLRIYWPQTLASDWTESYLQRLHETGGHKSLTLGLCILLPQKRLLDIVKKYAPTETENLSDDFELVFNLRKNFAKNMHLARPPLPLDVVLLYAQGEHLQHVIPSLSAILYNISSARFCESISRFLGAPLAVQKLALRLVFLKLNYTELMQIVPDTWKSTSNSTIRTLIFKTTNDRMCKEIRHSKIEEWWELLYTLMFYILSPDESEEILELLSRVDKIPMVIRGKHWIRSRRCLKSLHNEATNSSSDSYTMELSENIKTFIERIMEFSLDEDFVAKILQESLEIKFTTTDYDEELLIIMSSYLLCVKNEESQYLRYEKILAPLLKHVLTLWNVEGDQRYYVRLNVRNLLRQLCQDFAKYVFLKDMVYPIKIFTDIQNILEENLTAEDFYLVLTHWKLATCFVKTLEPHKAIVSTLRSRSTYPDDYEFYYVDDNWDEGYIKASTDFAEACLQYLKEDVLKYGSTVWTLFAASFKRMFKNYRLRQPVLLETIRSMLASEYKLKESYLLAITIILPNYDHENETVKEIRKLIYSHPSREVKLHYYQRLPQ